MKHSPPCFILTVESYSTHSSVDRCYDVQSVTDVSDIDVGSVRHQPSPPPGPLGGWMVSPRSLSPRRPALFDPQLVNCASNWTWQTDRLIDWRTVHYTRVARARPPIVTADARLPVSVSVIIRLRRACLAGARSRDQVLHSPTSTSACAKEFLPGAKGAVLVRA